MARSRRQVEETPTGAAGAVERAVAPHAGALAGDAEAMLRDLTAVVKPGQRERFAALVALSDAYCLRELEPLGAEYRDVCRMMAAVLCQPGSPVVEGKSAAEGWAAAIVAAVGFVNFLGDKETPPTRTMAQVAAGFGVSESGLAAKSVKIRRMLDLGQFDPDWTLPSLLDRNPLVWMLETTTGMVVDVRRLPREEQARAFEMGLIPYVPADKTPHKAAGDGLEKPPTPPAAEARPPREQKPTRNEGPSLFDPEAAAALMETKPGATEGVIARLGGAKGRK